MWKIFFTYRDKSKCTVKGKGIITPELAVKCFYRYGLHAAESIYQQYPKKDHEPVPLEEKIREFGVDATEMKTAVLQAETMLDRMQGEESEKKVIVETERIVNLEAFKKKIQEARKDARTLAIAMAGKNLKASQYCVEQLDLKLHELEAFEFNVERLRITENDHSECQ